MFSGGSYEEVGRWLGNFLTSHAKRENARAEVDLESGDEGDPKPYEARLRLAGRTAGLGAFDYAEVAANRGSLAWCSGFASRVRAAVRDLTAAA